MTTNELVMFFCGFGWGIALSGWIVYRNYSAWREIGHVTNRRDNGSYDVACSRLEPGDVLAVRRSK